MDIDNEVMTEEWDAEPELHDERITRRRTRRTGDALGRLCSSWMRAGADMLLGSIDITRNVAEDMTDAYCDRHRGDRDRDGRPRD